MCYNNQRLESHLWRSGGNRGGAWAITCPSCSLSPCTISLVHLQTNLLEMYSQMSPDAIRPHSTSLPPPRRSVWLRQPAARDDPAADCLRTLRRDRSFRAVSAGKKQQGRRKGLASCLKFTFHNSGSFLMRWRKSPRISRVKCEYMSSLVKFVKQSKRRKVSFRTHFQIFVFPFGTPVEQPWMIIITPKKTLDLNSLSP